MALGSAGCLITDPPEFQAPKVTPPLLTNFRPAQSELLEIPRKEGGGPTDYVKPARPLQFDILSEDLQSPLYVAIFIDFPRKTVLPTPWPNSELPPGTLDEPREISRDLVIPSSVAPGCHSITALVSHKPAIFGAAIDPKGDLGTATWWAQIGFDASKRDFSACEQDAPPSDGGRDAAFEGGAP